MSKKTKAKEFESQVEEQVEEQVQEQVEEQVEEVKEVKKVKKVTNEFNVVKILQKQPKGYRLLLEDGRIVKVSKDKFVRGQKTVIL